MSTHVSWTLVTSFHSILLSHAVLQIMQPYPVERTWVCRGMLLSMHTTSLVRSLGQSIRPSSLRTSMGVALTIALARLTSRRWAAELTVEDRCTQVALVLGSCEQFVSSSTLFCLGGFRFGYYGPPGAVGCTQGSGCFHFASSFSVWDKSSCVVQCQQLSCRPYHRTQPVLPVESIPYPLLSGIRHIAVRLEQ